jgi:hypothetical protein
MIALQARSLAMTRLVALHCVLFLLAGGQPEKKRADEDSFTVVQAAKEEVRLIKVAAEIMTRVADKKTASTAVDSLKMLRKGARVYWLKTQKLRESTTELDADFQKEAEAALSLFQSEVYRIKGVQGGAEVRQGIQALFLAKERGCDSEDELKWQWSDEKASLTYSVKQHLQDSDVEVISGKEFYTPIKIRTNKDQQVLYSIDGHLRGHQSIVFTRWKETLFLAEYCPIATGCEVVALDLKTGKTYWKSRLFGTGPTPLWHSKYSNHINIETDGKRVIVYGNEDDGQYVEHLDINTGKTLGNRRFDSDPDPQRK